jgi:2-polyprenyl-6-methoxyphenol hydroxylase-like FAD-dependent oxidoreductase
LVDNKILIPKLEYYTGGLLGKLKLTSDRLLFPVQLFQSRHYVQSRLALIGDAAHRCHPLGGQGLNLGIKDAAALAQVLSEAHQRGEDIGEVQVLKRYERWRNPLFSQRVRRPLPKSLPHLGLTLVFAPAVKRQCVVRVPTCIRIN